MLEIITRMLDRALEQLYTPGLQETRQWILDNYRVHDTASPGIIKMIANPSPGGTQHLYSSWKSCL